MSHHSALLPDVNTCCQDLHDFMFACVVAVVVTAGGPTALGIVYMAVAEELGLQVSIVQCANSCCCCMPCLGQ
jgi:NifB/MoaA-like Fe-S oxidoreductase